MSDNILLENIRFFWNYVEMSTIAQLYFASVVILILGMAYEIWSRSVRLSFLEKMSLQSVEKDHPYVPSLKIIVVIFLCSATLLIVALQTLTGLAPYNHPNEWMVLGGFFMISGAFGMLAETHWQGASDDVFAFVIGTSLAFLYLVFHDTWQATQDALMSFFLFVCLLLCIALAWTMLLRQWTTKVRLIAFVVFVLWVIFLSFR